VSSPTITVVTMSDVSPEQSRDFHRVAAHASPPRRSVAEAENIKVECAQLEGSPWYAVVLGKKCRLRGLVLSKFAPKSSATRSDGTVSGEPRPCRHATRHAVKCTEQLQTYVVSGQSAARTGWPGVRARCAGSGGRGHRCELKQLLLYILTDSGDSAATILSLGELSRAAARKAGGGSRFDCSRVAHGACMGQFRKPTWAKGLRRIIAQLPSWRGRACACAVIFGGSQEKSPLFCPYAR
jgi:hypothetical protein